VAGGAVVVGAAAGVALELHAAHAIATTAPAPSNARAGFRRRFTTGCTAEATSRIEDGR